MSEWQPIETAPRDGTEILVFVDDERPVEKRMVVAWFDQRPDGSARWAFFKDDTYRLSLGQPVLFWQPLPEPPQ